VVAWSESFAHDSALQRAQAPDRDWDSRPENARFSEQFYDFIEGDDEFRNSRYACIVSLLRATTSLGTRGMHALCCY
jgi:hypothetical protein